MRGLRLIDDLSYDKFDDCNHEYYLWIRQRFTSLKDNPMEFVYLKRYYNEKTNQFEG
jgi:hypothetical protein